VARILAIADEVDETLYGDKLRRLRPDIIVSCGDLPYGYLDNLVSRANVPLVYVPGNHDPDLTSANWLAGPYDEPLGPPGGENADGRVVLLAGLRIAGLGGSLRYNLGPNQYTQGEMRLRALSLETKLRLKRTLRGGRLDLLLAHAPPLGTGDGDDPAHQGFAAFHRLIARMAPRFLIHGHIHPDGLYHADRRLGSTDIVNAIPSRLIEL
jgi:Icc-related predicted phosphoesterase